MQTQTTGTATMTETAGAATAPRTFRAGTTRAEAEALAARWCEESKRRAFDAQAGYLRCAAGAAESAAILAAYQGRVAACDAEYARCMAEAALLPGGAEFLTVSHLNRYVAGLARLDAAVKASCPDCGSGLETVRDFGSVLIQCSDPACFYCKSVEASH